MPHADMMSPFTTAAMTLARGSLLNSTPCSPVCFTSSRWMSYATAALAGARVHIVLCCTVCTVVRSQLFPRSQPDFVLYNAGTDCLEGDPLGDLNLSADSIVQRDELVFRHCLHSQPTHQSVPEGQEAGASAARTSGTPVMMVLSGGYQPNNAAVIARSVLNLREKFGLF